MFHVKYFFLRESKTIFNDMLYSYSYTHLMEK